MLAVSSVVQSPTPATTRASLQSSTPSICAIWLPWQAPTMLVASLAICPIKWLSGFPTTRATAVTESSRLKRTGHTTARRIQWLQTEFQAQATMSVVLSESLTRKAIKSSACSAQWKFIHLVDNISVVWLVKWSTEPLIIASSPFPAQQ